MKSRLGATVAGIGLIGASLAGCGGESHAVSCESTYGVSTVKAQYDSQNEGLPPVSGDEMLKQAGGIIALTLYENGCVDFHVRANVEIASKTITTTILDGMVSCMDNQVTMNASTLHGTPLVKKAHVTEADSATNKICDGDKVADVAMHPGMLPSFILHHVVPF